MSLMPFRLEEEEKYQATLSDYQEKEREKRQRALEEEKEKMASANLGIEQLRKVSSDEKNKQNTIENT